MTHTNSVLVPAVLACLLAAALWHDFRRSRIPNGVVALGIALALAIHALLPHGLGLTHALFGLALGLGALLPLYLLHALGAGDAKLMAMVGAFLGPREALGAVLFTFLAGAVMALAWAVRNGVLARTVRKLLLFHPRIDTSMRIPYSAAIAAGSAALLLLRPSF